MEFKVFCFKVFVIGVRYGKSINKIRFFLLIGNNNNKKFIDILFKIIYFENIF